MSRKNVGATRQPGQPFQTLSYLQCVWLCLSVFFPLFSGLWPWTVARAAFFTHGSSCFCLSGRSCATRSRLISPRLSSYGVFIRFVSITGLYFCRGTHSVAMAQCHLGGIWLGKNSGWTHPQPSTEAEAWVDEATRRHSGARCLHTQPRPSARFAKRIFAPLSCQIRAWMIPTTTTQLLPPRVATAALISNFDEGAQFRPNAQWDSH